jgi:putative protein-disulfide isomerase
MNESKELDITIFTDPLCCWSWAFEDQLQQLKSALSGKAVWQIKMGGLIPSWNNFQDNTNVISRPAQMGPIWMHAGKIAQKPIAHQLWINDPPLSSYPACISVKCAQLQSSNAAESMLQLLRNACMTEGKNIAKPVHLFEVATQLSSLDKDFNFARFKEDYSSDKGVEAFRADLELCARYRIHRFPTLIVKRPYAQSMMFSGYRPYNQIMNSIEAMCNC